jgi:hypothetical protein
VRQQDDAQPLNPDSDESREALVGAARDLVIDLLADLDVDDLTEAETHQLLEVLEQIATPKIEGDVPSPPAGEHSKSE